MKQIVIFKNYTKLSPYFTVKLLSERRESPVFCYRSSVSLAAPFELVDTTKEEYKYCYKNHYNLLYSDRDFGESVEDLCEEHLIDISHICDDREDPELIKIIQEINNTEIAKVITIPEDVNYFIAESPNDGEYIQEYGRKWI